MLMKKYSSLLLEKMERSILQNSTSTECSTLDIWQDGEIYTGSQLVLTKWLEYWTEPSNETISSKL
jgi:hypothetical protein